MADYCTHRDLKDVYPHLDEFDSKTAVYNWVVSSGDLYRADDCGLVTQLFANGKDLGAEEASKVDVGTEGEWYYESTTDTCYYYTSSDPNDLLMESGDDFATIIARYITNASYYLDSALNSVLPREQFKNADGTYDYVIIRLASLLAVYFMIIADDPENPKATALKTEVDETIDGLVNGRIKLAKDVTSDASQGVLRTITHTSGKMLPVDTRGAYTGVYDKIKIKITTAGALNVGKFTTSIKSSTGLKTTDLTPLAVNGDYQELAGGLEIRFAADSTDTTTWAVAANDEWELEVYGVNEEVDRGRPRTIRATR